MNNMYKQFFGRVTAVVFATALVLHVAAFFVRGNVLEPILLLAVVLGVVALSIKDLRFGILAAFSEIFIGGHGHLLNLTLFGQSFSLRMGIFAAVMLVWFIGFVRRKYRLKWIFTRDYPWLIFAVAVLLGSMVGFINNSAGAAFDDANSYVVMAYLLPLVSVPVTQSWKRELLQMFSGSVLWLGASTLLLSYLFTHIDGKTLAFFYRFVRDTRLIEVTLQTVSTQSISFVKQGLTAVMGESGYWYRIFGQSQIVAALGSLFFFVPIIFAFRGSRVPFTGWFLFFVSVLTLVLSFSRSFVLAVGLVAVILACSAFFVGTLRLKRVPVRLVQSGVAAMLAAVIVLISVQLPLPKKPDLTDASFYETSSTEGRQTAVASRWQLLGPLTEKISTSPFVGTGFGSTVVYTSEDPRIRELFEGGVYETYRFEWGYLDLWLKMGILGIVWMFLYVYGFIRVAIYTYKHHGYGWIILGLSSMVMGLFIVHMFTPYLNHPIGIALLLLPLPFLDFEGYTKSVLAKQKQPSGTKAVFAASTVSAREAEL